MDRIMNEQTYPWYMVNKDGMCTLCSDQADAEQEAKNAQEAWPHMGPHRAVRLVEVGDAGFTAADMATAEARGFREGQAAELAAMRAGGEPVAEMVPYHTPSGKRVAVISRFQHLPIGTKLYTHPKPAAQDAERPFPAIVDGLLWLCVKEHGAIKPLESASALPIPRSWKSSMLDAARKQGANHD